MTSLPSTSSSPRLRICRLPVESTHSITCDGRREFQAILTDIELKHTYACVQASKRFRLILKHSYNCVQTPK